MAAGSSLRDISGALAHRLCLRSWIIVVEFVENYLNEKGVIFRKRFTDSRVENILLQHWFAASSYAGDEIPYGENAIVAAASWIQLLRNALAGCVFLPGDGSGYVCDTFCSALAVNPLYNSDESAFRQWQRRCLHPHIASFFRVELGKNWLLFAAS